MYPLRLPSLICLLIASLIAVPTEARRTRPGAVKAADAYAGFRAQIRIPRQRGRAQAVKLSYFMTDQPDHQDQASRDKLHVYDQWNRPSVRNVVFRDGKEWGDSRVYRMRPGVARPSDKPLRAEISQLRDDVYEVQSNNPRVFGEVLRWTLRENRGRTKYLEIYAHGGGPHGIGKDQHQVDLRGDELPRPMLRMPLPGFAAGLRHGLHGAKLDVIYFRACKMGNLEALYEIKDHARYAVASQAVSSSTEHSNLVMPTILDDLAAQGLEARDIARNLSINGFAKRSTAPRGDYSGFETIAAYDMARVGTLKSRLNTLLGALRRALPRHREAIAGAYDATPRLHEEFGDLWSFARELQQRVGDRAVQKAAAAVRRAQREMLVHTRNYKATKANGVSIFMPARELVKTRLAETAYAQTRFAHDTGWLQLLREMGD